ncbi:MAG: hypothetical protein ACKVVP_07235 [Chloroflexota bacterium]
MTNSIGFDDLLQENERLRKVLPLAAERERAIRDVLQIIADLPRDRDAILQLVAETAAVLCGCRNAVIWLPEGDELRAAPGWG